MTNSNSNIKTTNPTTGKVEKVFEEMSAQEVETRIAAAHAAFQTWRKTSLANRSKLLYKLAETMRASKASMAKAVTTEMGMIYAESEGDIDYCAAIFDYYAEHGPKLLADAPLKTPFGEAFNCYEPVGVILSVQPWNFPYSQAIRSLAPAIMAGNTVVLKHASNVPQSALCIQKMFNDAGAPAGLYANLFLPGSKTSALLADERIKGVTLTGSEPAGSSLASMAGKHIKLSTLELGGNDAFVVLEDADLDAAVEHAVFGRNYNAGQVCTSPKRIILVKAIADEFVQKAKAICEDIKIGDPFDPETVLQPLSSEEALVNVLAQLEENIKAGATLVYGGKRLDQPGWFMQPTLLSNMNSSMPAYHGEVFGPVVCIYIVNNEAEAIAMANDSKYGLGGSVFSQNVDRAMRVARQIDTGMVYINHVTGTSPELPFGGIKHSGYGRELSPAGIYGFVNEKLIRVTTPDEPY